MYMYQVMKAHDLAWAKSKMKACGRRFFRLAVSLQSLQFFHLRVAAWTSSSSSLYHLGSQQSKRFRYGRHPLSVLRDVVSSRLYATMPHDNPPVNLPIWNGPMVPFSEHAMHVQASSDDTPVTVSGAILRSMRDKVSSQQDFPVTAAKDIGNSLATHPPNAPMTPHQLLFLGSVWFLSAEQYEHNQQQQLVKHSAFKPTRLGLENGTMLLQEGDYLRIHHTPRRFPQVYRADWSRAITECNSTTTSVVVKQGPGYCIIDKPPLIPVHQTVDNAIENVVYQLQQQQSLSQTEHDPEYLAPVQRLDTNTSGLLVLATTPEFAAYFAKLLRQKTKHRANATALTGGGSSIQKGYKCLVCLAETEQESVIDAWQRLRKWQRSSSSSSSNDPVIIKHYLQVSDFSPKRFVQEPSERAGNDDDDQWLECLMEITSVSSPIPLYNSNGNNVEQNASSLVDELWPPTIGTLRVSRVSPNVRAVAEVQVSLITGRTHQIRGQLSELGFPIVGDEQYGGAIPDDETNETYQGASFAPDPQLLALQCCELSFPDAEYETKWNKKRHRDVVQGFPSQTKPRVHASLNRAWWTTAIETHYATSAVFGTIDQDLDSHVQFNADVKKAEPDPESSSVRSDLLPPAIQLSPGRNKYIMARLRDPVTHKVRWFVKSSAPSECGGPYHANVAEDLVEWIHTVPGYETVEVEVTGGGRIDYVPEAASSTFDGASSSSDAGAVRVYGFSYRYGKGDHRRAAELIQEFMGRDDIAVTYDLADDLY